MFLILRSEIEGKTETVSSYHRRGYYDYMKILYYDYMKILYYDYMKILYYDYMKILYYDYMKILTHRSGREHSSGDSFTARLRVSFTIPIKCH